jgi:hypothetical protein
MPSYEPRGGFLLTSLHDRRVADRRAVRVLSELPPSAQQAQQVPALV